MQRRAWCGLLILAACSPENELSVQDAGETTPPEPSMVPTTTTTTTPPPAPTEPSVPPEPAVPVWIAFSGGGYYAHTAHAGVLMGLLEATGLDLTGLTGNVVGIAANSGGTWFSTQLAYSEPFRVALEDDPDGWTTTGYLGQTETLFAFDDPCSGYGGPLAVICNNAPFLQDVFAMGQISGATSLNWHDAVAGGVYAPFGMTDELGAATLDGPRQAWADGKTLVFASTVLTSEALLEEEPGFFAIKDYYDATPTAKGVPPQHQFAPAAFASAGADGIRPRFLLPGPLEIEWTTNETFGVQSVFGVLPDDASTDVGVVDAASASSALGAAAVSIGVLDESGISDPIPLTNDEIAYHLRDASPAFSVVGGAVSWLDPVPTNIDDQLAAGAIRTADGSWTDDTAVAYAVRALADVGTPDDFTILSFVGGRSEPSQRGAVPLPAEFERLFSGDGVSADGVMELCIAILCANTMSPAVFDGAGLDAAIVRWTWTDGTVELTHVEIPVVTVDNPSFGVDAGHSGVVHVFVTFLLDAPVFPLDAASFERWAETLEATRTGVAEGGGWEALGDVLGVR